MGRGGLSCGGHIAKWTLFIFNAIFWLCSVVILAVGIWLAVDPSAWDYLIIIEEGGMDDPLLAAAVYTMIGIGCFMFLVGFAGCWGACRESSGWLTVYCILVGFCLIVEIIAGVLAIVYKDKINETVEEGMYEQVYYHYGDDNYSPTLTEAWDSMQQDFECCGSYDYRDYNTSFYHTNTTNIVPESCCVSTDDWDQCKADATSGNSESDYLYTEGCYKELKSAIDDASLIIACVMFSLAFLQFIGLMFACCLKGEIADSNVVY